MTDRQGFFQDGLDIIPAMNHCTEYHQACHEDSQE
jgi:hypothetical protein